MKILITGGRGMLGRTLHQRLNGHEVFAASHSQVDVTSICSVSNAIGQFRPQIVIHCAAMKAVDNCETNADAAVLVNSIGCNNVAIECFRQKARLISISTDYVFSGTLKRPYHEWDAEGPISVYGQTKFDGEKAVRAHCPDHVILRLGWLYGQGGQSFIHSMLEAGRNATLPLKVVDDQLGNPTSTSAVAECVAELIEKPITGIIHATCEGGASRYELAKEIFAIARFSATLQPCSSAEFPRPASRPFNAQLEKRAIRLHGLRNMPHWKDELRQFLKVNPNG
jgi:dTDP-4-dehydrorhamnose reductase